eukprot:TRINITY_DN5198_c0_g1_i1.p1 TRINITY_DN5198_c0_g1~~TRINITY_DN5198_c0_g1_i1.p1  ORF type:complete len:230 (-),score=19.69 TRINITY_DN5198_c0_g1_i1:546-1235(-)
MAQLSRQSASSSPSFRQRWLDAAAIGLLQMLVAMAMLLGAWGLPTLLGTNLVDEPLLTLRLTIACTLSATFFAFTSSALRPQSCKRRKAFVCGLLAIGPGVLLWSLVALVFGAPLSLKSLAATLHWATLLSVLTVVPLACILGFDWSKWQALIGNPLRPFASSRERVASVAAHGALIGAWIGAIPMPLDWEKPWQEWPICCSFGMMCGYLVGAVVGATLGRKPPKVGDK